MTKTTFFVSVLASDGDEESYAYNAPEMADMFRGIFTNVTKIAALTRRAALNGCHTEVDVSQTEQGLLGRAVVDFESEGRVTMDKTKLSQLVKAASPWKQLKIEKRLVPEDSEQTSHAVGSQ